VPYFSRPPTAEFGIAGEVGARLFMMEGGVGRVSRDWDEKKDAGQSDHNRSTFHGTVRSESFSIELEVTEGKKNAGAGHAGDKIVA